VARPALHEQRYHRPSTRRMMRRLRRQVGWTGSGHRAGRWRGSGRLCRRLDDRKIVKFEGWGDGRNTQKRS